MNENQQISGSSRAASLKSGAASVSSGQSLVKVTLITLLANSIWGFSYVLNRIAQQYAVPVHILGLRFTFAGTIMTVLLLTARRNSRDLDFRGKPVVKLVVFALVSSSVYFIEAYAIYLTNATFSGAISALTPIAAMVLAIFLLREYPTKKQALFSFVPVFGVILMTAAGNSLGIAPWYGVLVAIGNCLFCALFRVVNRWCAKDFNFFQRTWATMVTSMVLYTVLALITLHGDVHRYLEPFHHSGFVGALLILAVFCSVTATLLANYGAGRLTVVRYSALGTTTTLVASLAGILLLQEPVSLPMCIGIIMIIVGVWKVNTTGKDA